MRWLFKSPYRFLIHSFRYARFVGEFLQFRRQLDSEGRSDEAQWSNRFPCLEDRTTDAPFDAHYIYHTAWAARVIARQRPVEHVDISSSLYFVAIASAYTPIRFYDYRPAQLRLNNLSVKAADLSRLPFSDRSIASLSCMHVLEHVGLGRYGDPLDPWGDRKAASELQRVLAHGGTLLIAVPVGLPRICFNAHRIYSCLQVKKMFDGLKVKSFALVNDSGDFITDASERVADTQRYGLGCFEFSRPTNPDQELDA